MVSAKYPLPSYKKIGARRSPPSPNYPFRLAEGKIYCALALSSIYLLLLAIRAGDLLKNIVASLSSSYFL